MFAWIEPSQPPVLLADPEALPLADPLAFRPEGADGLLGLLGAAGLPGCDGPVGEDGLLGSDGSVGVTTVTLPPPGDCGVLGVVGVFGAEGAEGELGALGAAGALGASGAFGALGGLVARTCFTDAFALASAFALAVAKKATRVWLVVSSSPRTFAAVERATSEVSCHSAEMAALMLASTEMIFEAWPCAAEVSSPTSSLVVATTSGTSTSAFARAEPAASASALAPPV